LLRGLLAGCGLLLGDALAGGGLAGDFLRAAALLRAHLPFRLLAFAERNLCPFHRSGGSPFHLFQCAGAGPAFALSGLCHDRPPRCLGAHYGPNGRTTKHILSSSSQNFHIAVSCGRAAALAARGSGISAGFGPPVDQSISSTRWTTGMAVACPICTMHPRLLVAIRSGLTRSILAALRAASRRAMAGWSML